MGEMGGVGGALGKLDPTKYREHGEWVRLMMAAHSAGIRREDWIEWCVTDPLYAEEGEEVGRRWDNLKVDRITAWAFRVELRLADLDRGVCPKHPYHIGAGGCQLPVECESKPKLKLGIETLDLQRRWASLERIARRDEEGAFWVACRMREIIAENRIKPEVAVALLEGVGVDRRVISAGFLCTEDRLGDG
jgi:hypothetical protein